MLRWSRRTPGWHEHPASAPQSRSTGRRWSSPEGAPYSGLAFKQERLGVFYELFDADQEADGFGAVYDAVVVGERKVHHGAYHDLAFYDHGAVLDLVHPEYRDLRHGEDGRRDERAEDATVGDGERAA